jgi:opine dehydrogenase
MGEGGDVAKYAVVGGGNTAFGLAATLKIRGFEVALLEAPEFAASIKPVQALGGIKLRGVVGEGLAQIDLVTTDPAAALAGASVVFVAVPAYGHQRMAELILPELTRDQVLVLTPGNAGGALAFAQLLLELPADKRPFLAEASSCLFACKKDGPDGVWVRGLKQGLPVAALPATETRTVLDALNVPFPEFGPARDVLETSLTNVNHVVHPPGILLNLGRVELGKNDWLFYADGLSPAVCRVMEAVDKERVEVVTRLGLPPKPMLAWLLQFYGHQGMKGDTLYEAFNNTPVHGPSKGPRSVAHRYITEDVPYGLVPIASIGHELGVRTPTIDTLIALAGLVSGKDWWRDGRTVDQMGLAGMSAEQMSRYVARGST